ncbi:MAG: Thymidylate kinase [Labilithrix sp.]|nr:Thymidylate kinase [Labilithrix sp.]
MRLLAASLLVLLTGCSGAARVPAPRAPVPVTRPGALPEGAPREELAWATFSPETFARARAENKLVVLDGSAEWCHWCHVMEATTYHDPAVRKVLDAHFIAVKVDVDERPDLAERYGDYGWPATVLFSPDAVEIGKYRGYLDPEAFRAILESVVAGAEPGVARAAARASKAPRTALTEEHLAWIERSVEVALADLYDEEEGSWGFRQKAPLGYDNAWLLWKAEHGDLLERKQALAQAVFTLDKQSKLLDPVWGGIYQYSAAKDWDSPHFEKLMTFQAPALHNYATAFRLTGDPRQLARARAMQGYLERFLKGPDGGFYASQDADLNAHDRGRAFMDGHRYYTLGERERLAAGQPRVDVHEYGRENGLAIAAYATLFEVTKDQGTLATAEQAARHVLKTHDAGRRGHGAAITHDVAPAEGRPKALYLSDNAAFGLGLARLFEVTRSPEHLSHARAIADFLLAELVDEDGGGLFASTRDPDAVGVFAERRVPFEDNVVALRLLARVARAVAPEEAKPYRVAIDRILRAIAAPEEIKARGRMIGDFLLALEETKGARGALR